ncbi:hypothetical protein [Haloferula sargassicola]|uniref:Head domain of trimeric autotransporter adhesin n=1 Tax=Haloferula sargassicola TaxID=490096 RepID=A0ABP9UL77_9BACT
MAIEINGADETTVGPLREALKAAEKARALRFRSADDAPASPELPTLAGAGGKLLAVTEEEDGVEFVDPAVSGASAFTELSDAPSDYTGQSGKIPAVNEAEDGLEFIDPPIGGGGGAEDFTALGDAPSSYSGHGGKFVAVNAAEDGLEFVDEPSGGGGGLTYWTESSSTSSPNNTIHVAQLTPSDASSNVDLAITPKGTGSLLAQVPDNTTTGGSKRGLNATDWQRERNNATQVASGSNSAIGGGIRNKASGTSSTVAGGNTNTASGDYSAVGGGESNTAAATDSFVGGGKQNTTNGTYSTVSGGYSNTASGTGATIAGGSLCTASGNYSYATGSGCTASVDYAFVSGGNAQAAVQGKRAHAAGSFSTAGDAQIAEYVMRRITTDGSPGTLTANASSVGGTTNQVVLTNNSAVRMKGEVIARNGSTGDVKVWEIAATAKRGANAAATSLVGMPVVTAGDADASASAWDVAITADTTNGALAITVTGEAATNIRWVARLETVEVG